MASGGSNGAGPGAPSSVLVESNCHNHYLQSKQGTNYKELEKTLIELVKKNKKSNAKMLETLRSLSYYHLSSDLLAPLLQVLTMYDDRKILRTVYYFLQRFSQLSKNDAATTQLFEVMGAELTHATFARRMLSMRTWAVLSPPDELQATSPLATAVSDILKQVGVVDDAFNKQAAKRTLRRKNDLNLDKPLLEYAAFSTCRIRYPKNKEWFSSIVQGMACEDPAGARHAIALCYEHALEEPAMVAGDVLVFLPHLATPQTPQINLSDTFARIYFVKLLAVLSGCVDPSTLASSSAPLSSSTALLSSLPREPFQSSGGATSPPSSSPRSRGLNENTTRVYYQALCQAVVDANERVAFEAIAGLAQGPWKTLVTCSILPTKYAHELLLKNSASTISAILTRLVDALKPTNTLPLLHAAAKCTAVLARAFTKHQRDEKIFIDKEKDHPLLPLIESLQSVLDKKKNIYIRLQAIKALIWLSLTHKTTRLQSIILNELKRNALTPALFSELFESIRERTETTEEFAEFALQMVYHWYQYLPEKVDADVMTAIWSTVLSKDKTALKQVGADTYRQELAKEHETRKLREKIKEIEMEIERERSKVKEMEGKESGKSGKSNRSKKDKKKKKEKKVKPINTTKAPTASDAPTASVDAVSPRPTDADSDDSDSEEEQISTIQYNRLVLENIFEVLDCDQRCDSREVITTIKKRVFAFLAENCFSLVRFHKVPKQRRVTTRQSSVMNGLSVPVQEKGDEEDEDAKQEAERLLHFKFLDLIPPMKAIVTRLEQAAIMSPFETRVICLEGLIAIAFRSQDMLRLHIFEFLQVLRREGSLSSLVHPALELLSRTFEVKQTIQDKGGVKNLSDTELQSLNEETEELLHQMQLFAVAGPPVVF